jgi:hypothetical protein
MAVITQLRILGKTNEHKRALGWFKILLLGGCC